MKTLIALLIMFAINGVFRVLSATVGWVSEFTYGWTAGMLLMIVLIVLKKKDIV